MNVDGKKPLMNNDAAPGTGTDTNTSTGADTHSKADGREISPRSPSSAPRVGIVGTGGISRSHARGWLALGAHLHVFSEHGAEEFAEQFSQVPSAPVPVTVHPTFDSLLSAVDVVDVCTPTTSHPEYVHAALDAEKDVLCEKPLALHEDAVEAMVQHAHDAGRTLYPAHVVRFFPQYEALKRAVDSGRLGELAVLRFERSGSMPHQPWFANEAESGGIIMDQMIHDIDQALWLAGPATSVYAVQKHPDGNANVRAAHVVLTHRSGALSLCRGLWGPEGTVFHYSFDVAGSNGRLHYDSARNTGVDFDSVSQSGDSKSYLPSVAGMKDPYGAEIADFWECVSVSEGRSLRVNGADAVSAITVANAARESIRTGERIAL